MGSPTSTEPLPCLPPTHFLLLNWVCRKIKRRQFSGVGNLALNFYSIHVIRVM